VARTKQQQPIRPVMWAERMVLPGVPNLHRVSELLYRSGQPTANGMRRLKAMGIRSIVNLRAFHSDKHEISRTLLKYEHIPMKMRRRGTASTFSFNQESLLRFVIFVTTPKNCPVLLHCQYGADRAGVMCAVYRMVVDGWSREAAVREMEEGDFGFSGILGDLRDCMRELNVAGLRKEIQTNRPTNSRIWR